MENFTDLFRKEVTRFYLHEYCFVKTDAWEDKDFKLDRYFTSLTLSQEDESSGKLVKTPLEKSHDGLFDIKVDDQVPSRILVYGEAGSGKSTLCKKLAYDWAKQVEQSPLKNVPVVCALEFRKIQETETIVDAICNQLLSKDSTLGPDEIRKFIKANPDKIIIILDGFDEFDAKSHKGDINDLLQCRIMAEVRILVTTRPWHACSLQTTSNLYVQVSLDGFDIPAIKSYVQRYFGDEEASNQGLERIWANGFTSHLAHTPILLSMICFMIKVTSEDTAKIDTLNSLFESFLRAIVMKYFGKHHERRCTSYTDVSSRTGITEGMQILRKFWDDLGRIALDAVMVPGKKTVFSENELTVREDVRDLALKTGLLVRYESKLSMTDAFETSKIFYSFPHLLFHEKCAGDYLAHHRDVFDSTLRSIVDRGNTMDLGYTLAFSSGKKSQNADHIMRSLVKIHDKHASIQEAAERGDQDIVQADYVEDSNAEGTDENNESVLQEYQEEEIKGVSISRFNDDPLYYHIYGTEYMLFELGILISFESQAEDKLLTDIIKLLPKSIKYGFLSIKGLLCHCFLYFLNHVSEEDMTIPQIKKLLLDTSSHPISIKELILQLSMVCSRLRSITLYKSLVDLNLGLPGDLHPAQLNVVFQEETSIHELSLQQTRNEVSLEDLIKFISYHVCLQSLAIDGCTIDIACGHEVFDRIGTGRETLKEITLRSICNTLSFQEFLLLIDGLRFSSDCSTPCSLIPHTLPKFDRVQLERVLIENNDVKELDMKSVTPVSMSDALCTVASSFPNLRKLEIDGVEPTHMELPANEVGLPNNSALQKLKIKSACALSMSDVLNTVAVLFPNLRSLELFGIKIDLPHHTELHKLPSKLSSITYLTMESITNEIGLLDLLICVAKICPSLTTVSVTDAPLQVPESREVNELISQSGIKLESFTSLYLSSIESILSLSELLNMTAVLCPNAELFSIKKAAVRIPRPNELLRKSTHSES